MYQCEYPRGRSGRSYNRTRGIVPLCNGWSFSSQLQPKSHPDVWGSALKKRPGRSLLIQERSIEFINRIKDSKNIRNSPEVSGGPQNYREGDHVRVGDEGLVMYLNRAKLGSWTYEHKTADQSTSQSENR